MTGETPAAKAVVALLTRQETVVSAESLTGGLVADAFVTVPGTSAVFRGGVVAYATELKHELLGVDADLLEARGAVDPDVALQMAAGVRRRLGATWGVATTGVAGPEPQDGVPPGVLYVAVDGPGTRRVDRHELTGDREEVRAGACTLALELLLSAVRDADDADRAGRPGGRSEQPATADR
jgi:nicotinamide-nucleotide amidase